MDNYTNLTVNQLREIGINKGLTSFFMSKLNKSQLIEALKIDNNGELILKVMLTANNNTNLYIGIAPGRKDTKYDRDLIKDITQLKENNITCIINLMEEQEIINKCKLTNYKDIIEKSGLNYINKPIKDRTAPKLEYMIEIVETLVDMLKIHNVYIHCLGGLGRSGCIVACLLVKYGYEPSFSINYVRTFRPGAIQTKPQTEIIYNYYNHLKNINI